MKLKYIYILSSFCLVSCHKNKSKTAENLKAAQDTTQEVDTKKKSILNHRF